MHAGGLHTCAPLLALPTAVCAYEAPVLHSGGCGWCGKDRGGGAGWRGAGTYKPARSGGGGGVGCHRLPEGELRPAAGHPPTPVSPNVSNPFPWLARALSAPHCSHSKHGTWEEKISREFPHCLPAPISVSPLLSLHFCVSVSHSVFVLASPPLPSAPHSVCVCGGGMPPEPAPHPFQGTWTCPGRSETLLVETAECLVANCQRRKEGIVKEGVGEGLWDFRFSTPHPPIPTQDFTLNVFQDVGF